MTERPIDFAPLDPRTDPERFDRLVRSIGESARPELSARQARNSVFTQLSDWRRPLLVAAAIMGIASVGTLTRVEDPDAATEVGVAEAIGVPETIAGWVRSGETPTTAELLIAWENGE